MKLTFIASFIDAKTGIERVNLELLKCMLNDKEIESVDVVTSHSRAQVPSELFHSKKLLRAPFSLPRFFSIVYKNPVCVIANVRPWAILAYALYPFLKKRKKIIRTIPDIIAWHYPQFFPAIISFIFKVYGIFFKNFPSLYILHSEFTKNNIHKSWNIAPDKIKVVKLGSFIEPMQPRENFSGNKILYVETIEPRKGVDKLLDAFEIVEEEITQVELILCGKVGWKVDRLIERINNLVKSHSNVKYLGYVNDEKLVELFREVNVCVYTSLYEGFGLPPLEAMACGCPVIASESSSLPEVVGDAGILVNPQDVNNIAKSIIEVLQDEALKKKMSYFGVERVKHLNLKRELGK